jgi:hypothetical protein
MSSFVHPYSYDWTLIFSFVKVSGVGFQGIVQLVLLVELVGLNEPIERIKPIKQMVKLPDGGSLTPETT